tara:strand:- start:2259 stop:3425 length:1167 start_codon:yes stop_codon:yes gene_type:complete
MWSGILDKIYRAKPYIPKSSRDWIMTQYREILDSGNLIQGKYVKSFESEVKSIVGVKNAVATTSCGTGLETVLIASEIRNKKFIVPTQTFAASVNCIIRSGNEPLIVDVDEVTQCLSLNIIKENFSDDIGGVVLVHMSGLITPEMVEIETFCKDNNLFLLTDDAHAYGANYYDVNVDKVRYAGSFGDAGVFSFYPTKIITTAEGGMITTNNDELAEKCRVVRNHGTRRNDGQHQGLDYGYTCEMPSTNYRMSEFNAVLGISQNKHLDDFLIRRNDIADIYTDRLKNIKWLKTPLIDDYMYQSWWQYIVRIMSGRDRVKILLELLNKHNIPTANAYQPLCHQQKIYSEFLSTKGFKNSEDFINKIFSLPMYVELKDEQVHYICDCLESM